MSKRDLRLKEYKISNKRYKELCGFCEQYPEWLAELALNDGTPSSPIITDMPLAPHSNESKVEKLAIRRGETAHKVAIVEDCARQAGKDLWRYLIMGVCYEKGVTELRMIHGMPISQTEFYRIRRHFYYLLDKAKV